jgi:hypothetical protein
MGPNGQVPTVIIETDSEEVHIDKDKRLRSAKFGRLSGSGLHFLGHEDSLV